MRSATLKMFFLLATEFVYSIARSQCTQSEWMSGGTFTDDASVGVRAWNNTGNAWSSDNSYATVSALILGQKTHYLCVTNFGFTLPSTSYVCGITAQIEQKYTGLLGNITDFSVKIIKGGVITGTNLNASGSWPNADAYQGYGSSAEDWGTTWTPADINNPGFGIAISANLGGIVVLPTAYIDHIRISVFYNEALPVQLLSMDAVCKNNSVNLSWETASETNNNYFTIQKSSDGNNFDSLGIVQGAGTSNELHSYAWQDYKSTSIMAYYRLLQTDFNGKTTSLPVIALKSNCFSSNDELVIYPNPAKNKIELRYCSKDNFTSTIKILDRNGKLILETHELLKQGPNIVSVDIAMLPHGQYYIFQMTRENSQVQARFIK